MADLLSLLMGVPALMHAFGGAESSPYRQQQEALAAQQAQYANAAAHPNSPLYQQTYQRYQGQNRRNLADVISEAQGQNRMASGMGRTPLFNAERGGENIFRNLIQGYQGMGAQSDQQTQAALRGAGQLNNASQAAYGAMTPSTAAGNAQQLSGYKQLYNMMGGQGQTAQQVPPQTSDTGIPLQKQTNPYSSIFSGLF